MLQKRDPDASNCGTNVVIRPFGSDLITFEMRGLKKSVFFFNFFTDIKHNKTHEVDIKSWSDFDLWPTIRCARIKGFQRTSKKAFRHLWKSVGPFFWKLEENMSKNRLSTASGLQIIFCTFFLFILAIIQTSESLRNIKNLQKQKQEEPLAMNVSISHAL